MFFQKVALIGIGLLGGSLGLAIKKKKIAGRVVGYVRRGASVADCQTRNVVDEATQNLSVAVKDADLVILCTPISQMRSLTEQMKQVLKAGALVTDVGSVKGGICAELEISLAETKALFVGSHPMAGAEKIGVEGSRDDLFEKAVVVITPTPQSNPAAVAKLEAFWQALGSRLMKMSPETHDDLVSRSSHLPHVVAAELACYVLSPAHPKEQAMLCANGFKDTTRIASGSPEMWRDISLANRKNLSRVLGVFLEDLEEFKIALDQGNESAVQEFFENAKLRRDSWQERSASLSQE